MFDGEQGVTGSISFTAAADGKGVDVVISKLSIAADEIMNGPFGYHIHDAPVNATGDCSSTLAHLNPYGVNASIPCDTSKPETCEVGDLAGKHGKIDVKEGGEFLWSYICCADTDVSCRVFR